MRVTMCSPRLESVVVRSDLIDKEITHARFQLVDICLGQSLIFTVQVCPYGLQASVLLQLMLFANGVSVRLRVPSATKLRLPPVRSDLGAAELRSRFVSERVFPMLSGDRLLQFLQSEASRRGVDGIDAYSCRVGGSNLLKAHSLDISSMCPIIRMFSHPKHRLSSGRNWRKKISMGFT